MTVRDIFVRQVKQTFKAHNQPSEPRGIISTGKCFMMKLLLYHGRKDFSHPFRHLFVSVDMTDMFLSDKMYS